tara:strand:- start:88 stop:285 length:198 start_codon:yes stop_codon:yes gene_type:complete
MSKYTTKFQYVSWKKDDVESIKKAETKKTKLEKQGYILKPNTISMGNLLIYVNPNYKSKYKRKES